MKRLPIAVLTTALLVIVCGPVHAGPTYQVQMTLLDGYSSGGPWVAGNPVDAEFTLTPTAGRTMADVLPGNR